MNDGILLLNKPIGITSHDAVNKMRRLFGTRSVGHTGTLDPMASGLLTVLIGNATKASEYAMQHDKKYRAGLRLGITTDTEDTSGTVLSESDDIPSEDAVISAAKSFVGDILQTPPMYSALKVGGKKLCDLAREGVTVEREPREIHIYSIAVARIDDRNYTLDVSCSKGTYIRTLCADIGSALGCGGTMSSLVRTESGGFSLNDAVTSEQLEAMDIAQRQARLLPVESLFATLPCVRLSDFYANLARNGAEIYQRKAGTNFSLGEKLRVYDKNGFFALGEVRAYDEGTAIKLIKRF